VSYCVDGTGKSETCSVKLIRFVVEGIRRVVLVNSRLGCGHVKAVSASTPILEEEGKSM
jgi:hypothetical protein